MISHIKYKVNDSQYSHLVVRKSFALFDPCAGEKCIPPIEHQLTSEFNSLEVTLQRCTELMQSVIYNVKRLRHPLGRLIRTKATGST